MLLLQNATKVRKKIIAFFQFFLDEKKLTFIKQSIV